MALLTATMNTCPRVIGFGLAKTMMTPTVNNRIRILSKEYMSKSHWVWTGQDHDDTNSE